MAGKKGQVEEAVGESKAAQKEVVIGVLSLQGAFEEHQACLENGTGCKTKQIRTAKELEGIDGIILPGGESTAMGLIGNQDDGMFWTALKAFIESGKPTWGTCAGMILLADRCVGASAVIENGQSLIGGMDVLVCRNYFGSQISSFEMDTPPPPITKKYLSTRVSQNYNHDDAVTTPYPGIFIRAPAILNAGPEIEVLGKVVATPCRQAAVVLEELQNKIDAGENVVMMGVVDALDRDNNNCVHVKDVIKQSNDKHNDIENDYHSHVKIQLPGASHGTNAREVICAAKKQNVLITSFHPELTGDFRWHQYFHSMVIEYMSSTS
mmetsp:Transcript_14810/g.21179  ORF Transcript_14810/g.21179 Transcript_14810/m.21179 type:complete len:323 (+) Transcript_14810:109-1077(+)